MNMPTVRNSAISIWWEVSCRIGDHMDCSENGELHLVEGRVRTWDRAHNVDLSEFGDLHLV